jgi:hypothetical protein
MAKFHRFISSAEIHSIVDRHAVCPKKLLHLRTGKIKWAVDERSTHPVRWGASARDQMTHWSVAATPGHRKPQSLSVKNKVPALRDMRDEIPTTQ